MHAKKFCADRGLAFPALEIEEMSLDSVQECYMFADSEDPLAPIILHFPLINQTFQQYKTVGELDGPTDRSQTFFVIMHRNATFVFCISIVSLFK